VIKAYTIAWFAQYFKIAQLFLLGYCSVASFCQHEGKKIIQKPTKRALIAYNIIGC
jgi:hypothetical protein